MVERKLPKLETGVRFPSSAGSDARRPVSRTCPASEREPRSHPGTMGGFPSYATWRRVAILNAATREPKGGPACAQDATFRSVWRPSWSWASSSPSRASAAPEKIFSLNVPASVQGGATGVQYPLTFKNETPSGNSNIQSLHGDRDLPA